MFKIVSDSVPYLRKGRRCLAAGRPDLAACNFLLAGYPRLIDYAATVPHSSGVRFSARALWRIAYATWRSERAVAQDLAAQDIA